MSSFDVSRRAFVVAAATTAALAAPLAASAAEGPAPAPVKGYDDVVPFAFDRAGFSAVLNRPFEHRQVIPLKSYADARDGLRLMHNSIDAYADPMYFAGGPNALHVAAVFYHGSSPLLALDDAMYAKYPIAATIVKFATGKPGIEADAKANPGKPLYEELVTKFGATFLVCNNALSGLSAAIASAIAPAGTAPARESVVALHNEFASHFLPGTLLVPAGVAAINAAQEARFTLLPY
jgi:hypothetical protein